MSPGSLPSSSTGTVGNKHHEPQIHYALTVPERAIPVVRRNSSPFPPASSRKTLFLNRTTPESYLEPRRFTMRAHIHEKRS